MIIIFDLDDTLYREEDFQIGGFKAVSKYLSSLLNLNARKIEKRLNEIVKKDGRGLVFDKFLTENKFYSKSLIKKTILIYRLHKPNIKLYGDAKKIIFKLKKNIYILTDGNKIVQKRKLLALRLNNKIKKSFITHNYGCKYAKPSVYCFKKIKEAEGVAWNEMMYIGDNPKKDFVNLNKKGVQTVRIMRGPYKFEKAESKFDARFKINNLSEIINIINKNHYGKNI